MRCNGIALILTVGILMLLSLAGVGMLGLDGKLRIGMSLRLEQVQAGLLARSGIEFATARLLEDTAPRNPATAANQPGSRWVIESGHGANQ